MSQHKEQGTSRELSMGIVGGVLTTLLLAVLSHLNRLGALMLVVGSVVAFNVIGARDWKEVRTRSTGRQVSWAEAVLTLSFGFVAVVVVGLVVVMIFERAFIECPGSVSDRLPDRVHFLRRCSMSVALFVRERLELSDAAEQVFLRFARHRGLQTGDTLVLAARAVTAAPGYTFDLRDPSDPTYLLNLMIVADLVDAPTLRVDVSGSAATTRTSAGAPARNVGVFARHLQQPIVVAANGGAGAPGVDGQPGIDETFTIDFDDRGKPHREYEAPTPGSLAATAARAAPAELLRCAGPPAPRRRSPRPAARAVPPARAAPVGAEPSPRTAPAARAL